MGSPPDRKAWIEIYGNTKSKKVNKLERATGIEPA